MSTVAVVLIVLSALVCGVCGYFAAKPVGREVEGFLVGLVLGPFGVAFALVMCPRSSQPGPVSQPFVSVTDQVLSAPVPERVWTPREPRKPEAEGTVACPKCGTVLPGHRKMCTKCGATWG